MSIRRDALSVGARVRTHDNAIGTVVHVDDHGWIDVREDGNGKVYSFLPSQLTRIEAA